MDARTKIALGDPALFRRQCYVNGRWMDAESGDAIEVDNPATREIIGTVPAFGQDETRAANRGRRRGVGRVALPPRRRSARG